MKRSAGFLDAPPSFTYNLPDEVTSFVLDKVDYKSVGRCLQVCKGMNQLMQKLMDDDPLFMKLKVMFDFAFGPSDWKRFFGFDLVHEDLVEAAKALPDNIHNLLKEFSVSFPEKTVGDAYLLFYIPKDMTLRNFQALLIAKKQSSYEPFGYRKNNVNDEDLDNEIVPGWVLMSKEVMPESLNKIYFEQFFNIITREDIADYHIIPERSVVTIGLYAEYFKSKKRYLTHTYTRCLEVRGPRWSHGIVGHMTRYGLGLNFDGGINSRHKEIGMVDVINFNPSEPDEPNDA